MSGNHGSDAVVRPVRAEDVPAVAELVGQVLAEFELSFGVGSPTDRDIYGLPASYEECGGHFWVAETMEGRLLGSCGVYPLDQQTVELRKMYVHPEARGLGLGRRFLHLAVTTARGEGRTQMVLDTVHNMTAAVALYEKAGFVRDDQQVRGARCNRGYRLDL